jgi:exonuclease VII small subunit
MSKETEKLKQEITELDLDRSNLFKIVDKLEQRIATLEKVLASHAKCIGEMREDKNEQS